ncbi:MAG: AAA family ATPase [Rhodomicrobium sp.]
MPAHAFLSYSREDKAQPERLYSFLTGRGLSVWRDTRSIGLGANFRDAITAAIDAAGCMLVLITPNSERSEEVKNEVQYALDVGVPIIPLVRDRRIERLDKWWRARFKHTQAIHFNRMNDAFLTSVAIGVDQYSHRLCRIIALFNMKGGVGKTMLASQIAARLHIGHNKRVLIIDLDPQQNLTELCVSPGQLELARNQFFNIIGLFEPQKIGCHESDYSPFAWNFDLGDGADFRQLCFSLCNARHANSFDIICSDFNAVKYTKISELAPLPLRNFKFALNRLKRNYDYIIIDCNPSVSFLTKAAIEVTDFILAPVRPDYFARRGLNFIFRVLHEFSEAVHIPKMNVVFNGLRPNIVAERELIRWIREGNEDQVRGASNFCDKCLQTEIPDAGALQLRYGAGAGADTEECVAERLIARVANSVNANEALNKVVSDYLEVLDGG